jgi:catechol 2,3-dioxygenase-like lactoylglutathione lyase family enzyme
MTANGDEDNWAALVPELLVSELDRALAFYRDLCGFRVRYGRPEDGFAYLDLGGAQIMLEELGQDAWLTGRLDPPFGRGLNLQIEVADVAALARKLEVAGLPLFRPLTTEWYRQDDVEHGQSQFLVQDPDGYLLRFVQPLATRPVQGLPAG